MRAVKYQTLVCRGPGCMAAGVRPTCTQEEGTLPALTVTVESAARTDLATLLRRYAEPELRGTTRACNGLDCGATCVATGVRCPCEARKCGGKEPGHRLQAVESRSGFWPPPPMLLVRIERGRRHCQKMHTPVAVPEGAFAVGDLVAQPPGAQNPEWRPCVAYYRAVAAGYHRGERTNDGHYWAIVRGTEPGGGGGYRCCNDRAVTSSFLGSEAHRRWDAPEAEQRVALVALERVSGPGVAASRSEKLNRLGPVQAAPAGRECDRCTLVTEDAKAVVCGACTKPLPRL